MIYPKIYLINFIIKKMQQSQMRPSSGMQKKNI